MALPSTGEISIADVVVYRAASSTAGKPWPINITSGFNNLNSYRGSNWSSPTTYTAIISNNIYDSCYASDPSNQTYVVTNTSSLFSNAGDIFILSITANSGYSRDLKTCSWGSNTGATSTYVFQNAPAGTYKVGLRVNPNSSGDFMNGYVGNTSNVSAYGSLGASISQGERDTLINFTIATTTSIRVQCSITPGASQAAYSAFTYARIMRVK